MITHFGLNLKEKPDGMNLNRDNYIKVSNKSSFGDGKTYDEDFIKWQTEAAYYNFDLNMEYFIGIDNKEFEKELNRFLNKTKVFKEVTDLNPYSKVSGYYMLVLDGYSQVYIGRTNSIKERIRSHWSRQMPFDRLIFISKEKSLLSVDSFRAYDTTRVFVYPTKDYLNFEDPLITEFDSKFVLNRTAGHIYGENKRVCSGERYGLIQL